jgi:hypothetical protein
MATRKSPKAKIDVPRKRPVAEVEAEILFESRRRCALCYGLYADLDQKRGQIAHIDRDRSNSVKNNLCFLCLPHHDEYDSSTSQSKRFTSTELLQYKDLLYERLSRGVTADPATVAVSSVIAAAREQACLKLERDAGYLVERLGSQARLEPDATAIGAVIGRLESNIGLLRRDQAVTQAVRDLAHQCKIILRDNGMFDRPAVRPAELAQLRALFDRFIRQVDRFIAVGVSQPVVDESQTDAAPFFSLVSGSYSGGILDFQVRNDGAPVTCLAFEPTTSGARVRDWSPTSLPTGTIFRAAVHIPQNQGLCEFRMQLRDKRGRQRSFEFRLNRDTSPQIFDFSEVL